jgi:uridine kinase
MSAGTSGYVIPSGASGGGSTTRVIQLVLDRKVIAQVIDEENYYTQQRAAPTAGRA